VKFKDTKRGNQKPQIEEGQTTQWPKERGQTTIDEILHYKEKGQYNNQEKKSKMTNNELL